jgi:selenocysteine-specific elongation factor
MHYVILGTAGHIDHGKSCLVKALTGTDPDRLKEEKERGITIDLGFADLQYPDGLTIGIVDVPGHERLVKNMLAGAGGIDMVLLVIAADEGIMPQSREHLYICDMLKIRSGLVVITKTDLVDSEWLELIKEDIREFVRDTFLEGAEIVPFSSKTGFNINLLKSKIQEIALRTSRKPEEGLFRLPVDRVFTLKGFGTVVTGTAVSGSIMTDESVEILPFGISSKVRGLHSHGEAIQKVCAGQRAALNLQGVEKDDLTRGDTLVSPGRFSPTKSIDARIQLLRQAPQLKSRQLVHFHLGTSETIARVVLYEKEQLGPGEGCYCQFRLDNPIVAQSGDRYVIRRFSPLETVGGGEVLDPLPLRRRKKDGVDDLAVMEQGPLGDKLAMKTKKAGLKGMTVESLEGWIKAEVPAVEDAVNGLVSSGTLIRLENVLMHRDSLEGFKGKIISRLEEFHKKYPLKHGLNKEEIRTRMMIEPRLFGSLVLLLDDVSVDKDIMRLTSFIITVSEEDKSRVAGILKDKGFQPPTKSELASKTGKDEKELGDILTLMDKEGTIKRINDSMYLSRQSYDRMIMLLKEHFTNKKEMTVSEFRDILGTTRKYALPFLEYLDSNSITLRVGDVRKFLLK